MMLFWIHYQEVFKNIHDDDDEFGYDYSLFQAMTKWVCPFFLQFLLLAIKYYSYSIIITIVVVSCTN